MDLDPTKETLDDDLASIDDWHSRAEAWEDLAEYCQEQANGLREDYEVELGYADEWEDGE